MILGSIGTLSYAEIIVNSDVDGISVEFNLPPLNVTSIERNGVAYQSVSYEECGFTSEAGDPHLPVSRILLGVPADASFSVEVLDATNETRLNHRLPPVPHQVLSRDIDNPTSWNDIGRSQEQIQTPTEQWREDGPAYRTGALFPSGLADIVYEGYIRSQRVICLALHPIQYNPKSRALRLHPRMVVRVNFHASEQNPVSTFGTSLSQNSMSTSSIVEEPERFERTFRNLLSNYDAAKAWRAPREKTLSAPAIRQAHALIPSEAQYKILVEETGIYRLTRDDLINNWGIDLSQVPVRNLHLRIGDAEVPIYIHGEEDGSFDSGDYIEFLGLDARNRYTNWNVYWLRVEREPGIRVSQIDATPDDPTATVIPVFRSKIHFEEDLLTSNLEHRFPDSVSKGDKHGWFDALDFWYWDGIRNSSDYNEMNLEFPLFDLARSFVQPKIRVLLQGGTPMAHEILTSVNGVRIDNAKWRRQDTITVEKTLRVWDNLKDVTKGDWNTLNLTRVDTTVEDDTTRYPYHVYVNSFDVEYTRLLKAVNDYLEFSSPASKESYAVRKRRNLQYTVRTFLSPDVEVFEHDGTGLISKLKNPTVSRIELDLEERNRLRAIMHVNASGNSEDVDDLRLIVPQVAFDATFQVPDTHDSQFVAVSSAGVRTPVRVEEVPKSELLSPANGADYLIITHPVFREPSMRLAQWRSTPRGGGFRTKVVDVTEIYDSFGKGMVDPKAIKRFLAYAYQNWEPPALSHVVLMGDGTYDFRGVDKDLYREPPEDLGYIPPHYIWTSSFGRTSADHWYATVSGLDELTDFYVGRLPAETVGEAMEIVDKIVNYEDRRPNGSWRRQIISVADDEVNNSGDFIFKKSLNEIAQSHTLLGYETIEIFLEDIIDLVEANPDDYPDTLPKHVAKERIIRALSDGAILAQYAGHGGRIVWAHENIFGNVSVDLVEPTPHIPFMLVLSCYNGYFDQPGEPSMAEKLLRKEKGGIIGMLSATRLTYGSGNDALNRIIFDHLFKRNERQLGALSFDTKVELLINRGISGNIDVMMGYTLFGDPAMKLAMADYEIQPKVQSKTVVPGGTVEIEAGLILEAVYDPRLKHKQFSATSDFNGRLQVKAIFPGNYATGQGENGAVEFYTGDVIVTKEAQVTNGEFPALVIAVPDNINSGPAHVEYYAESSTHIAVGGASLTVLEPKILDIQPEVVDETSFRISAQVSDELSDEGIKEIVLSWRNPETRNWESVIMIPDQPRGKGWYTVPSPLLLAANGAAIRYDIQVTDIDGNVIVSDLLNYRPVVFPNLTLVDAGEFSRNALIYYQYSHEIDAWTLNADIQQVEDVELKDAVEVFFFDGNPDLNSDHVVDTEARQLGRVQTPPEAWKRRDPLEIHKTPHFQGQTLTQPRAFQADPLNINWLATATLRHELPIGDHEIFAWIDPVFDINASISGKVMEGDDEDNLGQQNLQVRDTLIGKTAKRVFSHDGVIDFRMPRNVAPQPAVLTIMEMTEQEQPQPVQQTSLKRINLPNKNHAVAYNVTVRDSEPNTQLDQTVTAELRFDLDALKWEIGEELFGKLDYRDDVALMDFSHFSPEQNAAINLGAEQRAKEIGVYLWVERLGKWTRLTSELVTGSNGSIEVQPTIAGITSSNSGGGTLENVHLDPLGARMGRWVLLFTSASRYRLLAGDSATPLEVITSDRYVGFPQDPPVYIDGVAIDIEYDERDFRFGDVLTFDVIQDSASRESSLYAVSFLEENRGTGVIQFLRVTPGSNMPRDRWVILFVDSERFQIEGQESGVLSRNGNPVQGTVGEEFSYPEYGLSLKLSQGRWKFEAGDSFTFETREVGRVRAEVPILGPLTLMRSDDVIPPDIQLTIGEQNFVDGDPVSTNPLIQATLTDNNGIDYITRPLHMEMLHDGDSSLIPATEYRLSHLPGSNQVVLNYRPYQLDPGTYQVRLAAGDLEGNESEKEVEFRVHRFVQLLNATNYPNPFTEETTITCELTGAADEVSVKIYSLSGRLVQEFSEEATAGFMMIPWDGRDRNDEEVANGVYYCKIRVVQAGEKDLTELIKLMKLK
ncbi:MAG: C25 family cysteine peptidase [Candidatus Poribacteria bacterium]|nr:C25 family cysteine peptidase [Candidatus Poribacteria bacterium]